MSGTKLNGQVILYQLIGIFYELTAVFTQPRYSLEDTVYFSIDSTSGMESTMCTFYTFTLSFHRQRPPLILSFHH